MFDHGKETRDFCESANREDIIQQQAEQIQKAYRVIMDLLTETCNEDTCPHTDCAVARGMDYINSLAAQPQKRTGQ